MEVVTVKQCGGLIQYTWIHGALVRLDDLSTASYLLRYLGPLAAVQNEPSKSNCPDR